MSDNIDTSEFQLQDEFTENDDQSTLIDIQLSSGVIRLQTFQFLKYSVAFQKECFSNDKSNNLIEKLQHVRENSGISEKSLITFIKLLRDEKINITNDQFCDLCYLSDTFKVKSLQSCLRKYLYQNSRNIDLIINLMINQPTTESNDTYSKDDFLKDKLVILSENVEECLLNPNFIKLEISTIYNIIENCKKPIQMDLLYEFISKSIEERFILFYFLDLEKLSDSKFNELYENYEKVANQSNKSFYNYLPKNLEYIKKLKEAHELECSFNKQEQLNNSLIELKRKINEIKIKKDEIEEQVKSVIFDTKNSIRSIIESNLLNIYDAFIKSKEFNQLLNFVLQNQSKINSLINSIVQISETEEKKISEKYLQQRSQERINNLTRMTRDLTKNIDNYNDFINKSRELFQFSEFSNNCSILIKLKARLPDSLIEDKNKNPVCFYKLNFPNLAQQHFLKFVIPNDKGSLLMLKFPQSKGHLFLNKLKFNEESIQNAVLKKKDDTIFQSNLNFEYHELYPIKENQDITSFCIENMGQPHHNVPDLIFQDKNWMTKTEFIKKLNNISFSIFDYIIEMQFVFNSKTANAETLKKSRQLYKMVHDFTDKYTNVKFSDGNSCPSLKQPLDDLHDILQQFQSLLLNVSNAMEVFVNRINHS
ncbi:hypothetical protein M9Y10_045593 [Tritrichomonas musculus]|uniref:Uncharacterized protein n=1 Tax=Tritrichomonas musculus TaxID=1915356 RepID=A0ABR2JXH6_9EUKA